MSTAYASEGQSGLEQVAMLLDAYRASELAHRRAADRARSQQEREALLRKAHERARFARELDTELSMLGGTDPDDFRASDSGDGPQAWPRADDDLASLVARTEMRVRSEVERSLGGALPTELQTLLERHARSLAYRLDGDGGSSVSLRR